MRYIEWLELEMRLRDATPQTYTRILHEVVNALIEDAQSRAIREDDEE